MLKLVLIFFKMQNYGFPKGTVVGLPKEKVGFSGVHHLRWLTYLLWPVFVPHNCPASHSYIYMLTSLVTTLCIIKHLYWKSVFVLNMLETGVPKTSKQMTETSQQNYRKEQYFDENYKNFLRNALSNFFAES